MRLGNNYIKIKSIPEDFLVEENLGRIINHEKKYDSKFVILILNKCGFTTFEAIENISKILKLDSSSIGYAGLKDEDGITWQKISLPIQKEDEIEYLKVELRKYEEEEKFIDIRFIGYSASTLHINDLSGNTFSIVLRNVSKQQIDNICQHKKYICVFPNYYDEQRFGMPGLPHVTHKVGEYLLQKNYEKAYFYFDYGNTGTVNHFLEEDKEEFFKKLDPRRLSFYYNSNSSFIFNQELKELFCNIDKTEVEICSGGKISFPNNMNDIVNKYLLNSVTSFTRHIVSEKEIIEKISYRNNFGCAQINIKEVYDDYLNPEKYACRVTFSLPSGTYASLVIKHFLVFKGEKEACIGALTLH